MHERISDAEVDFDLDAGHLKRKSLGTKNALADEQVGCAENWLVSMFPMKSRTPGQKTESKSIGLLQSWVVGPS
jgi:hypothetical protein